MPSCTRDLTGVKSSTTSSVQSTAMKVTCGSSPPASATSNRFTASRQMPMMAAVASVYTSVRRNSSSTSIRRCLTTA